MPLVEYRVQAEAEKEEVGSGFPLACETIIKKWFRKSRDTQLRTNSSDVITEVFHRAQGFAPLSAGSMKHEA